MCEIRVVLEFWKKSREHTSISSYFLSLSLSMYGQNGVLMKVMPVAVAYRLTHTQLKVTALSITRPVPLPPSNCSDKIARAFRTFGNMQHESNQKRIQNSYCLLGLGASRHNTRTYMVWCLVKFRVNAWQNKKKKTRASSVRRVAFFGRVFLSVSFIEFYFIDISNSRRLQAKLCQCQKVG